MAVIEGPEDEPFKFDGDDLEFPTPEELYEPKPGAKHTDFDTSKGAQTVDGVKFDLGPILKGTTDAVTATAKAVAEVSKAQAAADNKKSQTEPIPKETTPPKEDKTKPSSSPPAPVAKTSGSTGAYVALGGGVVVVAVLAAVLSSKKRKGRAL